MKKELKGLTIFHGIGLLLALALMVYYNYFLYENETFGFIYLGIYGIFLGITLLQRWLLSREGVTWLFHFLLGVKTIAFFLIFMLYGSFGYVFSENVEYAFMSVLLILFALFGGVNVFVEQVYLNKMICNTAGAGTPLNGILSKKTSELALNFPLVFQTLMGCTMLVYTLQMSFLGPIWLALGFIGYCIINGWGVGALRNPSKKKATIRYTLTSIVKNLFLVAMFFGVARLEMQNTKPLYLLYEGMFYGLKVFVVISILIDLLILFKLIFDAQRQNRAR